MYIITTINTPTGLVATVGLDVHSNPLARENHKIAEFYGDKATEYAQLFVDALDSVPKAIKHSSMEG